MMEVEEIRLYRRRVFLFGREWTREVGDEANEQLIIYSLLLRCRSSLLRGGHDLYFEVAAERIERGVHARNRTSLPCARHRSIAAVIATIMIDRQRERLV